MSTAAVLGRRSGTRGTRERMHRATRVLTTVLGMAATFTGVVALEGCGGHARPETVARKVVAPQWQDVFDGTPEFYAVIRPQAIKRDAVYGSFFKTLLRVAQARTEMTGVTTLEALEGCEEVVIGIRRDVAGGPSAGEDSAFVLRGVPANLDPAKMTDRVGQPLFRIVDEHAAVAEYAFAGSIDGRQLQGAPVPPPAGQGASMFVLPGRTWVVTLGAARARARQAFASPFGRPVPKVDPNALAVVRLEANAFLRGRSIERSSAFGPLVRTLTSVNLALEPAKEGAIVSLQYETEDASAWAEMHTKRLLEEIVAADAQPATPNSGRRRPPGSFAWLKDAKVDHEGNSVRVHLTVPARLLEELPNVAPTDLSL